MQTVAAHDHAGVAEPEEASPRPQRKVNGFVPAIGLFFFAPLVAEQELGNQPITALGSLALLAPMYGGRGGLDS